MPDDSPPRTLDPGLARRFNAFARSFADDEVLSDEQLNGADLRTIADWIDATAQLTLVPRLTA